MLHLVFRGSSLLKIYLDIKGSIAHFTSFLKVTKLSVTKAENLEVQVVVVRPLKGEVELSYGSLRSFNCLCNLFDATLLLSYSRLSDIIRFGRSFDHRLLSALRN